MKHTTLLLCFLWFSVLSFTALLTSPGVNAAVFISEVHPNPVAGEGEWIELFNDGTESVDLSAWTIEDQLSSPSLLYQFGILRLQPGSYKVILLESSKLNNTADGVTLKNIAESVVHTMSYDTTVPGQSWTFKNGQYQLSPPSPGQLEPPLPSPSPSSTPQPTIDPSPTIQPSPSPSPSPPPTPSPTPPVITLELSEIYPCPQSGENEWIEVYNPLTQPQTFIGKVKDSSSNTKPVSLTINASNLAIIEWSGSLLNNDGDRVILEDSEGREILNVGFGECDKGTSFIFLNQVWQLTTQVTKNAPNPDTITSSPNPSPSPSPSPIEESIETYDWSDSLTSSEDQLTDTWNDSSDDYTLPELILPDLQASTMGAILGTTATVGSPAALLDDTTTKPPVIGLLSLVAGSSTLMGLGGWKTISWWKEMQTKDIITG